MTLKPTGNYTKAALFALLALAVIAAEIALIVSIQMSGISDLIAILLPAVGGVVACLVVPLTLGTVAVPFVIVRRERTLRMAVADGAHGSPLAAAQPDRSLALPDGETLALMRRRLRISMIRDAAYALQLVSFVMPLGLSIYLILPFGASLLDVGVLAYLFLVVVILAAGAYWICSIMRGRWLRIIADDRGVTVERPLSARRFIPWNDMLVFLRRTENPSGAPDGMYVLWGRDHFLQFDIGGPSTAVEGKEKPTQFENVYRYEGGYDLYAAHARRLLATIAARSYVALRTQATKPPTRRSNERTDSVAAVSLADALAAPAPVDLQPTPEAIAASAEITGKLKLASRLATPAFFAQIAACFLGLLVIIIPLGMFLHLPYLSLALLLAGDPFAIMLFALLTPMLLLYAFLFAAAWQRRKAPAVMADDTGLAVTNPYLARMRWRDVRAWGVIPSTSRRPTTYLVFSSDQTLRWVEPEGMELGGRVGRGNRRAAYAKRAERLHALITARTGLPLRELRLGDSRDKAHMSH